MEKTRFLIFLALCILSLLPVGCSQVLPSPTAQVHLCPELERGLSFLMARYNPELGLLNEAPNVAPHIYWLTNDNVLAAYTFEQLGRPEISTALNTTIEHYGRGTNGLIEVLWGVSVKFPPHVAHTEKIAQIGENQILQEFHNRGNHFEDWHEYADLAFWGALNTYQQGSTLQAEKIFASTMAFYDGVGFHDKAYQSQYETYKLALALYVGSAIEAPVPNTNELYAALRAMQKDDGGFFTHYIDVDQPTGDTNTETTSLALLALQEKCR